MCSGQLLLDDRSREAVHVRERAPPLRVCPPDVRVTKVKINARADKKQRESQGCKFLRETFVLSAAL